MGHGDGLVQGVRSAELAEPLGYKGCRVVLVTNAGPPVLRAYIEPLAALDDVAEVTVIRDRADVRLGPKVRIVVPAPWWPLGAGLKLIARRLLLRRHAAHADVLMTLHWFPDGPMVVRRGVEQGLPVVANIIGSRAELIAGGRRFALAPVPGFVKRWAERHQRRWLNRATAVSYTGRDTAEWFRAAGVAAPASFVVHAAVDTTRVPDVGGTRMTDVAYVGRVHADKRIDRLFAVLSAIGRRRPGTTVKIIGVGAAEVSQFAAYRAARATLGDGLELYGRVTSVEAILERSKVLLLTSDTEGRTLAVLEAMASGTVPVVTRVGDLEETLDMGAAGITVPVVGDEERIVATLAHEVIGLLESEERRRALAAHGRSYVCREHTAARASEDWRRVLDALIPTRQ
jgi:glycosyltransferase involved in cell wall biosynthesis